MVERILFDKDMSDIDPRSIAVAVLTIIALLAAWSTYNGLMSGDISLSRALTPSWTGFASANPMLFAFIAVGGTLILGKAFVNFLENI